MSDKINKGDGNVIKWLAKVFLTFIIEAIAIVIIVASHVFEMEDFAFFGLVLAVLGLVGVWSFKTFFAISTKPEKTSYIWARRTRSLLATIVLWVVWAGRLLSIFQWCKYGYRRLGKWFKFGYVENDSGRPDVPPKLGEFYFCFLMGLFAVTHLMKITCPFLVTVSYYYIFESCVWVMYYTVFRRFFELGYTIYHQLEYILTIAIIIPTQALCFARIYSMSFKEVFMSLLGMGDETTPLPIIIFGFFLSAIVIGIVISTFPTENIKEGIKKAKMIIIGCGDVVKSRLYPALINSKYSTAISCYDIKEIDQIPSCHQYNDSAEIQKACLEDIKQGSILWIETPPNSHLEYTEYAINNGAGLVIVEKPIAISKEDIKEFKKIVEKTSTRNKLFFLSYYILEKALPLTFLANIGKEESKKRVGFYKKYLDISGEPLVMCWKQFLGKLKLIKVDIIEGKDDREWIENNGGQLYETFIHHMLIAVQFCGLPVEYDDKTGEKKEFWECVEFVNGENNEAIREISLKAQGGNAVIDLLMRKNDAEKTRMAILEFENGSICADFDKKNAVIHFTHMKADCEIKVKDEFSQNYNVLVDMVGRVYSKEELSKDVDGFENQIDILRWLDEISNLS